MTTKHTDEQIAAAFELAKAVRKAPVSCPAWDLPVTWKDLADKATAHVVGPLAMMSARKWHDDDDYCADGLAEVIEEVCQPDELRRCLFALYVEYNWADTETEDSRKAKSALSTPTLRKT